MAATKILIVDGEVNVGTSLRLVLEGSGFSVQICRTAAEFQRVVPRGRADAYLLDVRLPNGKGIDLLHSLRQTDNQAPAIMISGHGTIADAVAATRAGAFDFLEKPLGHDRLLPVLKNALELIRQALAEAGGNVSAAARMLGIERSGLHKRIRALELDKDNS
jgi:DNA-binding NtrC family response regulator